MAQWRWLVEKQYSLRAMLLFPNFDVDNKVKKDDDEEPPALAFEGAADVSFIALSITNGTSDHTVWFVVVALLLFSPEGQCTTGSF